MTQAINGITPGEVFRLVCAYLAIRSPGPRREILALTENWARDQWFAGDQAEQRSRSFE